MGTVFPAHTRPSVPQASALKWRQPIRSDSLGTFGSAACTLLATRGMAHIVKRFDRAATTGREQNVPGSGGDVDPHIGEQFDEPDNLLETLEIHIPYPHPMARQAVIAIGYYAHDEQFYKASPFVEPHIKMRLTKLDGAFVDPPDAANEWAIEASRVNGVIPPGGERRSIRDNNGEVVIRELSERWLYCAFPEAAPAQYPTGPRRLNYGQQQDEHLVVTIEAKAARVFAVTLYESPRLVVNQ